MPVWLRLVLTGVVAALLAYLTWRAWRRAHAGGRANRTWWWAPAVLALLALWWLRAVVWQPGPPSWDGMPRWMTCIDCSVVELHELDSLARREPDSTVRLLATAFERGLGEARRADLRRTLARMHARDSLHLARSGDTSAVFPPRDAFVRAYLASFERAWRVRAALGLGRVASVLPPGAAASTARAVLLAGSGLSGPVDTLVVRAALRALDTAFVRDSLP